MSAAAEPVERDSSFLENLREFESERVAVELHGAFEIADGKVRFEEAADGDHGCWLIGCDAEGGGSKAGFGCWQLATSN